MSLELWAVIGLALLGVVLLILALCQTAGPRTPQEQAQADAEQVAAISPRPVDMDEVVRELGGEGL